MILNGEIALMEHKQKNPPVLPAGGLLQSGCD